MKPKNLSILLIGNSFSYYHGLPRLISECAKATKLPQVEIEGVFKGGGSLKMFWEEGKAIKKLEKNKFNYVVLQERGRLGGIMKDGIVHVGNSKEFLKYFSKFNALAKKSGAKIILYCPPSFLGIKQLEDANKLHRTFMDLAKSTGTPLISAIPAFMLAQKHRPDINLFEKDGHHPNHLGMYLIASLFYKKLFRKKAINLPLVAYSSRAQKLPLDPKTIKINKKDAEFLWLVANKIK